MAKYINCDEMLADENEAYLNAQSKITDKITRDINYVIHTKLQNLLADAPAADVVSRGVLEQVMWERDLAISQLAEIGKGFGEKMDEVTDGE